VSLTRRQRYSVIRNVKVCAAGYPEKCPDFLSVSDIWFVGEITLATLGCSRMLLIFDTSQSEHYFLCDVTRLESVEEDHSSHSALTRPDVDLLV